MILDSFIMILNDLTVQYCIGRPSARRRRFSLGRAPARPPDGGDSHSGGRPPVRPTAAILTWTAVLLEIITRAGARPSAGRRRFSLGRAPARSPEIRESRVRRRKPENREAGGIPGFRRLTLGFRNRRLTRGSRDQNQFLNVFSFW